MAKSELISIVIPVYNEEASIQGVIEETQETMRKMKRDYEILVVDDGSTDSSTSIAEKTGAKVISHPKNLGYGAALKTGFRNCRGDVVLFFDADGSYPVGEAPQLLEHLGAFDMVVMARIRPFTFRKLATRVLAVLSSYIAGKRVLDPNSGMRALRGSLVRSFESLTDGFSFSTSMTLQCMTSGLRVLEIPLQYRERHGRSKLNPLIDGMKFLTLLLRLCVDFAPLKVFMPIGFLSFTVGVLSTIRNLVLFSDVTDVNLLLILFGIQIILFGLLADLVIRYMRRVERS